MAHDPDPTLADIPTSRFVANTQPIRHDGWRSRKLIVGTALAVLILTVATVLAVWSGHYSARPWFSSDNWLSALWAALTLEGFALGLLTAEKLLQLIQAVMPILAPALAGRGK